MTSMARNGATLSPQPDLPVFREGPPRLEDLRDTLIRLEETIIFALIERAQFKTNERIYRRDEDGIFGSDAFSSDFEYDGSYLEFIIERTEQVHSLVNRYTSPDEEAFFPDRVSYAALLPAQSYPPVLHPNKININKKLLSIYTKHIVPGLCSPGDDRQYGSSAVCDTVVLQALSRRIHYGKFVAEAKFCADKEKYSERIRKGDADWLMDALTVKAIEEKVMSRVELKASTYGRDPREKSSSASPPSKKKSKTKHCKVDPSRIRALYSDWVMPLTKEVELDYLLQRLSGPTVAFCDARSTSHEIAARVAQGGDEKSAKNCVVCTTEKAVVQSVLSNKTTYGVLPLAESNGIIRRTRSLLCSNDKIMVCGVRRVQHTFDLVELTTGGGGRRRRATEGAQLTSVQTIFAATEALSCCEEWLEIHVPQAALVRVQDTRTALERANADTEIRAAALVLAFDDGIATSFDSPQKELVMTTIAHISGPSTVIRHVILSKRFGMPSGDDRTLLQFEVKDAPGSLNDALTIFQTHDVNLTMLESYPVSRGLRRKCRGSVFFVECEGHARQLSDVFSEIRRRTMSFRVIGSYPNEHEAA